MAARHHAWLFSGALALSVGVARAQVGPPVGVEPVQTRAVAQPETQLAERPLESQMPLMAPPEREVASPDRPAGGGWGRSAASVALVVGLILVLAAAARFFSRRSGSVAAMLGPGGRAPSGVLEVLARYPVGRGQVLVLLRIDRRVLLLSQSMTGKGGAFATLAQFDEPSEVAAILRQTRDEASESVSARFRQALERFQGAEASVDRGEIIEVGPRGEVLPKGRGVWA
jgi:flagellar biogenesis protein FliO